MTTTTRRTMAVRAAAAPGRSATTAPRAEVACASASTQARVCAITSRPATWCAPEAPSSCRASFQRAYGGHGRQIRPRAGPKGLAPHSGHADADHDRERDERRRARRERDPEWAVVPEERRRDQRQRDRHREDN